MTGPRGRVGSVNDLLERAREEWSLFGARGRATERSLVWMLGSPRTGSTWLLNLLTVHRRVVRIDEPGIGYHLGLFVQDVMGAHPASFEEGRFMLPAARDEDENYFFSRKYERIWRPRLRHLILARLGAQIRNATRDKGVTAPIAVIKEPAGSQVAEFLFSILPASRLLFLVRDPRDVLDSALDAVLEGSWLAKQFHARGDPSPAERAGILRGQTHRWLARMESVQRAYDLLPENQRYMVRYEDLRADTVTALRGILRWLELDVDEGRVRAIVERLSFDAIPDSSRGKGKFTRAAAPGMWRENLRPDEVAMIEATLGDSLERFGYEVTASSP